MFFKPDKYKQDRHGERLPIVGEGCGLCTEYRIAVITGDVRVSGVQWVIQNITVVRMQMLMDMVKRWEALGVDHSPKTSPKWCPKRKG